MATDKACGGADCFANGNGLVGDFGFWILDFGFWIEEIIQSPIHPSTHPPIHP
jgi:hypothetical protein